MKTYAYIGLLLLCVLVLPVRAADPYLLLAQADPSKQVVMYSTSWCPHCQRARDHFRTRGIPYVEYDIEKDETAKQAYKSFGGKIIPVIFVGKRRMNGFSADGFDKMYR